MSAASPASTHPTGLAAALAVVRLVMALLNTLFADIADLPPTHPDRRRHTRLMAALTRAEAQILADIDTAARPTPPVRRARAPHAITTPELRPRLARPTSPLSHPPRAPPAAEMPKTTAERRAETHVHFVAKS